MKIMYVHSSGNNIAGSEIVLLKMIDHARSKYDVEVMLPETGIFNERLKENGITAHIVPVKTFSKTNPIPYLKGLYYCLRTILNLKPDVIHMSSASPMQYVWPVAKLFKIPVVNHIQCPYDKDDLRRYFPHKADRVIVISEMIRNIFSSKTQNKIVRIYNGINIPQIDRNAARRELLRLTSSAPKTRMIGMVGQVIPRKGIDVFLRAAAQVIAQVKHPVGLVIAGNPNTEYGRECHRLSQNLGISDQVHWIGFQKDAQAIMAGMDVLIVPSRSEGFGLVAAEALAVGTPVIASNTGGLPEIVENSENGFLIPVDDVDMLAERIRFFIDHPLMVSVMGHQGILKIQNSFSYKAQYSGLDDVYASLISANI
ncbi:MAG: glycosyltransferase family 4 protein [SAR324 cluster bacterium]|nr:glycosyltransferase family 4 protein [SAR324 cluster bacterium]